LPVLNARETIKLIASSRLRPDLSPPQKVSLTISEHHAHFRYSYHILLFRIKSHTFKEGEHRLILYQNLRGESKQASPPGQTSEISEQIVAYAHILILVLHNDRNLGGVNLLIYLILSNCGDSLFAIPQQLPGSSYC